MLDLFFPPICSCCDVRLERSSFLCLECAGKLKAIKPPWCARCGLSLPISETLQLNCLSCYHYPPHWDALRSVFVYQEPLRHLIHRWKFNDRPEISELFGEAMEFFIHEHWHDPNWQILIPVPLHPIRFRERDYNQALLLTQVLSNKLNIPLSSDALRRIRHTLPQSNLSRSARNQNLRGAFQVNDTLIQGRRILLVDDLYTTGATLNQCALALKREGADRVDGLTLARVLS